MVCLIFCLELVSSRRGSRYHSLGQLIKIIRENQMELVVDSLINYSVGKDEELRDISGLGQLLHIK